MKKPFLLLASAFLFLSFCVTHNMELPRDIPLREMQTLSHLSTLESYHDSSETINLFHYAIPEELTTLAHYIKKDMLSRQNSAPAIMLISPNAEQAYCMPRVLAQELNIPHCYSISKNSPLNLPRSQSAILIRNLSALWTTHVTNASKDDLDTATTFVETLKKIKKNDRAALICGISEKDLYDLPTPIKEYFACLQKDYNTTLKVDPITLLDHWKILQKNTDQLGKFYLYEGKKTFDFNTSKRILLELLKPLSAHILADVLKGLPFKNTLFSRYIYRSAAHSKLRIVKEKLQVIQFQNYKKKYAIGDSAHCSVCKKQTQSFALLSCCTTEKTPNALCDHCFEARLVTKNCCTPCPNCTTELAPYLEFAPTVVLTIND